MVRHSRGRGFTVIEMMVVLTVMAILVGLAAPRYVARLDQARETALRHDLKAMRDAIDQYQADRGAAPQSLSDLVQARYLREIPEDPITQQRDSWVFEVAPGSNLLGTPTGRAGVRSGATGAAKDGTRYATW